MLASRLAQIAPGSGAAATPPSSSAARPDPHAVPTSTELVTRPDGLRRGVWEGSPWIFWTLAALVVIAVAVWGLRRFGLLGGKKSP